MNFRSLVSLFGNGLNRRYVMSTFGPEANPTALTLLRSPDGRKWLPINGVTVYDPDSDYLRDPSIVKIGSTYWLAYTTGQSWLATETSFGIAKSTDDLKTFSLVATVDCSAITGVNRVWAPEWFIDDDDSVHVLFNASTDAGDTQKLYEVNPTNAGMTTWSAPTEITGTDLPTKIIDPFVVKIGATYHLWYKNDNTILIEYASSSALTSGYTVTKSGDWAGWGTQIEGPCLIQIGSIWRLYFDSTDGESGVFYSESTDWETWSAKQLITSPAFPPRHGTVIRV